MKGKNGCKAQAYNYLHTLLKKKKMSIHHFSPSQKRSKLLALLSTQLALLLTMAGCSFSIAEKVVKPFLTIIFNVLHQYEMNFEEIGLDRIPTTPKTMSRHVKSLSTFIEQQTIREIKDSPIGFCIQIDESTDVADLCRLYKVEIEINKSSSENTKE